MNLEPSSILFNKNITQCRSIGRRGGRARARNLRLRLAQKPETPPPTSHEHVSETTHEANALLNEGFPHLRPAHQAGCSHRAQMCLSWAFCPLAPVARRVARVAPPAPES